MSLNILVLPGDHVGPEVVQEAVKVLKVVEKKSGVNFELDFDLCGGCSIDKHGKPVTDEVVQKAKKSDAVFFGSVGGPKWYGSTSSFGISSRELTPCPRGTVYPNPESGLLTLRQQLEAFANLRPCCFASDSLIERSPLKPEHVKGVDFTVVRENCGGAYFGPKVEEATHASDSWAYTQSEIERCARVAAFLALQHDPPLLVTSSDKANVLASGRLWRRVVSDLFAKEFPKLELKHQLADSLAMIMIQNPRAFNGVVLTDNTFGDMLSDEAGGLTGSLGLLPSASLCGVPNESNGNKVRGIYEPVHGSAPDIAGKGIVNPVAQILSASMMLRYSFAMNKEADAIDAAVKRVLGSKEEGGLEIRTG